MTQPNIDGTGHGIPRMLYASDGSNWYAVLVDSDGHVKIDVVSTALPTGAATAANQAIIAGYIDALETLLAGGLPAALDSLALKVKEQSPLTGFATSANQTTMITALQLIDDLRAALGSVDTDDLQVDVKTYPGSNALGNIPFGYNDRYQERATVSNPSAGPNDKDLTAVPAGEVWVISSIWGKNDTRTCQIRIKLLLAGFAHWLAVATTSAAGVPLVQLGNFILKEGDYVRITFFDNQLNDTLIWGACGYKMKVA